MVTVTENNWEVRWLFQLRKYSAEEQRLRGWLVMTTTSRQPREQETAPCSSHSYPPSGAETPLLPDTLKN